MDRVEPYKPDGKQSEAPASAQTRQKRVLLALGTVIVTVALVVALVVGLSPQAAKELPRRAKILAYGSGARRPSTLPARATCYTRAALACRKICGEDVPHVCLAVCLTGCICPCGKEWTDKDGGGCYAEVSQCPGLASSS